LLFTDSKQRFPTKSSRKPFIYKVCHICKLSRSARAKKQKIYK
jgi:hypothetical protein